jgi:hypothetical protein
MSSETAHNTTTLPPDLDFDTVSQKGWNGFTKFLTVNTVATVLALLLIGALTVWR